MGNIIVICLAWTIITGVWISVWLERRKNN